MAILDVRFPWGSWRRVSSGEEGVNPALGCYSGVWAGGLKGKRKRSRLYIRGKGKGLFGCTTFT